VSRFDRAAQLGPLFFWRACPNPIQHAIWSPRLNAQLRQIRHVVLDLDGTIYRGHTLFKDTLPFLGLLTKLGIGFTFLTNNSSRSRAEYLRHLNEMGIRPAAEQLYTSTDATIEYLRAQPRELRRLFVLGTPSLAREIVEAGFSLADDHPGDEPDAVVVGFDTTLVFRRLCRAAYWIGRGKPFIATHPDRVCPTDEPTVLVDCGSICAALERATGRTPDAVLGKPSPAMIRGVLNRHQLAPEHLAVVGDRLYTDMLMARRAGALSVLVLTGETRLQDLASADSKPDVVVRDLGELAQQFQTCNQSQ
jgi:HAD superfamily hydrolase (TIGR01450 family)